MDVSQDSVREVTLLLMEEERASAWSMHSHPALPDAADMMVFNLVLFKKPRYDVLTLKILARVTSEMSDECPKSRG